MNFGIRKGVCFMELDDDDEYAIGLKISQTFKLGHRPVMFAPTTLWRRLKNLFTIKRSEPHWYDPSVTLVGCAFVWHHMVEVIKVPVPRMAFSSKEQALQSLNIRTAIVTETMAKRIGYLEGTFTEDFETTGKFDNEKS